MPWKIEILVDDGDVENALNALKNIARQYPIITPLDQVSKTPKPKKSKTNGTEEPHLLQLFAAYLKKTKHKVVNKTDLVAFLESMGRSPASSTYLAKLAVKHGLLTKQGAGSATTYLVTWR